MVGMLAAVPSSIEIFAARRLRHAELLKQHIGVGIFEIMPRVFLLGLEEYIAVGDLAGAFAAVEIELHDAVDPLQIAGKALQSVGELARNRRAFEARDLLKVSELRHFHTVAPAFPAEPPGPECRALPI